MIKMKKLNNKGFSLVELIIVIAIMAILVGVVGTQVIPYLEKSRQSKDMQIFSAWNTAAMSAYSMNTDCVDGNTTVEITINGTNVSVTAPNDGSADPILTTFKELTGLNLNAAWGGTKFSSKKATDGTLTSVVIRIDTATTEVTTTMNGATDVFATIENK
jgi:type IV pilus assembly protein PilA